MTSSPQSIDTAAKTRSRSSTLDIVDRQILNIQAGDSADELAGPIGDDYMLVS